MLCSGDKGIGECALPSNRDVKNEERLIGQLVVLALEALESSSVDTWGLFRNNCSKALEEKISLPLPLIEILLLMEGKETINSIDRIEKIAFRLFVDLKKL
jgi:hypothetical protein